MTAKSWFPTCINTYSKLALGAWLASTLLGCDGEAQPPGNTSSVPSILALASECGANSEYLSTIDLYPTQVLNTLELAFNLGTSQSGEALGMASPAFNHDQILAASPISGLKSLGGLIGVAEAFLTFRQSQAQLCDLADAACSQALLTHFYTAVHFSEPSADELEDLMMKFAQYPARTIADIGRPLIYGIDLELLDADLISAIRLSLLFDNSLPTSALRERAHNGEFRDAESRIRYAEQRLAGDHQFSASLTQWMSRFKSGQKVAEMPLPHELLTTLMQQTAGQAESVFKGTYADLFTSAYTLVSQENIAAYLAEGAADYGAFSAQSAYNSGNWQLMVSDDRPGILTKREFLVEQPLRGYHLKNIFACGDVKMLDHVSLYGDEYEKVFQQVDAEQAQAGYEFPHVVWLGRAFEIGDQLGEPACTWCHTPTHSLDKALTMFDSNGDIRSHFTLSDGSVLPIETQGQFYRISDDSEIFSFDSISDFLNKVTQTSFAKQCFVDSWLGHGLQAKSEFSCQAESLYRKFDANGGDIYGLLMDVIASDLFISNGVSH